MEDQQFFKQKSDNSVFLQILQKYLPFWPLFVLTIAISIAIAAVYLRSQVPIFVASAKALLKDPGRGGGDSRVLDALNIANTKTVENEIIVLRSTNIMNEVAKELELYATVYNEGRVRIEELYKSNSPVWFHASESSVIYPSEKYYFQVDWNRQQVNIDNRAVHFNDSVMLNNTVYSIEPNPAYLKTLKGKNYFVQFNSVEGAAGGIISKLNATPVSPQSTVLNVTLETPVPEKGIDIVTKLFEVYNSTGIQDKNQTAAKMLAFIDGRLRIVISQLDSVEKNVESYRSKNQAIDLSTQGQMFLSNVADLDKRKSEVDLQLDLLNDVNNYISNKDKKSGVVPSLLLISDPALPNLLGRLYDAETQLQRSKSIAGEKSDAVILAEDQVNRFRNDIHENIINIRKNLLAVKQNINSNLGAKTNKLSQIPQKERGLIEISRQQGIKNNIYSYLLQTREETAISSASTIADLRVIEKAGAYGPIKPIAKNFYLGGLFVGVLIPVLLIFGKEQFNRKVLFRNEIEEKTKVPVVGEIMQVETKNPIVILEGKRTAIAEQFRSLRTNLGFMALSEDAKTTLITSNISGEGKSFISINLAISYTITDKKVALLELDLRKPRLSKLLNVERDPGISNYLVGKIPLEGIIKKTSINNLYVISAGAIPPNPSELILSNKFKDLMAELKGMFDILVIDSAPIGPVSDSLLLKDYADTTMFVVRHNRTPKISLKQIENLSQQKMFKNICIVFNGLKRRGIGGAYGYGSYGYGYSNYGYGSDGNGGGYYDEEGKKSFFNRLKNVVRNKRN
ncbi:MAG: GumC family protein [Chitinophagaceae bacterium]